MHFPVLFYVIKHKGLEFVSIYVFIGTAYTYEEIPVCYAPNYFFPLPYREACI